MTLLAKSMKAFCAFRAEQSMFKDVNVFHHLWDKQASKVVGQANDKIAKVQGYAADPFGGEWARWGFASMINAMPFFSQALEADWEDLVEPQETFETFEAYAKHQVFIKLQDDQIFFVIEKRERVLPGDTLRAEVEKECAALAKRQGHEVDRKQRMEIKDVVVARELATAKIRTRRIPVLIQTSEVSDDLFDVIIFTSSRKLAEDAGHLLRRAFGSWPVYPMENDLTLPLLDIMTRQLKNPDDHPFPWRKFQHGDAAKLVCNIGGEVTMKDEELTINTGSEPSERVKELLDNSYLVHRMRYCFWNRSPLDAQGGIYFQMTSKGSFTGLKPSENVAEASETDDAWLDFNAFIFILSDYLQGLLESLHALSVHYDPDEDAIRYKRQAGLENEKPKEEKVEDAAFDTDPLLDDAAAFVRQKGVATISGIQRHFRIGFNRSARILEQLEEMDVVTAPGANGSRTVVGAVDEDDLL